MGVDADPSRSVEVERRLNWKFHKVLCVGDRRESKLHLEGADVGCT